MNKSMKDAIREVMEKFGAREPELQSLCKVCGFAYAIHRTLKCPESVDLYEKEG